MSLLPAINYKTPNIMSVRKILLFYWQVHFECIRHQERSSFEEVLILSNIKEYIND